MNPLATARTLRTLQMVTIALAVAGNLSYWLLTFFGFLSPDIWMVLPFSLLAAVLFAILCVSAQHAAHELGGPPAPFNVVAASFFCALLGWVGIPMTLYRTAQSVAAALDDDVIRSRGLTLAWAVALAPIPVSIFGGVVGFYALSPIVSVVLMAVATQLVTAPLIEELRARGLGGGVDGERTSVAFRSV